MAAMVYLWSFDHRWGFGLKGYTLWAAMFAAVAGGYFASLDEAAAALVKPPVKTYTPIPENHEIYDQLFAMYLELHDAYGVPGSLLKRLRALRRR